MGVWEFGGVGGVFPPYSHTPKLPYLNYASGFGIIGFLLMTYVP